MFLIWCGQGSLGQVAAQGVQFYLLLFHEAKASHMHYIVSWYSCVSIR